MCVRAAVGACFCLLRCVQRCVQVCKGVHMLVWVCTCVRACALAFHGVPNVDEMTITKLFCPCHGKG